jgi:hypothetical protein
MESEKCLDTCILLDAPTPRSILSAPSCAEMACISLEVANRSQTEVGSWCLVLDPLRAQNYTYASVHQEHQQQSRVAFTVRGFMRYRQISHCQLRSCGVLFLSPPCWEHSFQAGKTALQPHHPAAPDHEYCGIVVQNLHCLRGCEPVRDHHARMCTWGSASDLVLSYIALSAIDAGIDTLLDTR